MWEDLEALIRLFGDAEACASPSAAQRSVDEIEAWLAAHDVDAWFTGRVRDDRELARAGGRVASRVVEARRLGLGEPIRGADAEVRARIASPVLGAGVPAGNADAAAGAARARAPRELLSAGVGSPSDRRHAVPARAAGPRRDRRGRDVTAGRVCSGSAPGRRRSPRSVDDRAPRHLHRGHRTGSRTARRDRLDGRRGARGPAHRAPLLPHHPRRTDRLRRGGSHRGRGGGPRTAPAV